MSHAALVRAPLDEAALRARVSHAGAGAVTCFVGTVREENDGRAVSGIDYTAYEAMALRELGAVADEAEARYAGARVAVEHRLGALAVGEASIVIAASHPHRAEAFDAARYVIEQVKRRVPIWKREGYVDGTREWVHAGTSAPAEVSP